VRKILRNCLVVLGLGASFGLNALPAISNADAVAAMKDALNEGIKSASSQLSVTDGYFGNALLKILLPPEAKSMVDSVAKIPKGQQLIDDVVLRLNRAAEDCAKDVVPIFVNAIATMSVDDGISILKGGDKAATAYLETKTRAALFDLYRPKVDAALDKPLVGDTSAKKSWDILCAAYNQAGKVANSSAKLMGKKEPMPPMSVDLAAYATNKALDGLFVKIGEEEAKIRKNPVSYASDTIKKVFGALKSGLF
jgi:hypothetical protein